MIPLLRPNLPKLSSLQKNLKNVFKTGMITNAKYVQEFEKRCADFLGTKETVAVSSGTSALILAFTCLDLKGEVILPSFTFTSGGHSLLWCGLRPVFADIEPDAFNIDPKSIEQKITKDTCAILATHVFGNPCKIYEIQQIAEKHHLKVIFDGAHAFGAKYKGKPVACFGDATIFSFTPTKVLTTAEGGLIAVNSKELAEKMRSGRNNGDNIERDKEFLGISARMDEFSAILGIEGLKILPQALKRKLKLVNLYKRELSGLPGISFQKISPFSFSVYKDLTILVDERKFGLGRDGLIKELDKNDIKTKVYFDPPLHRKKVYRKYYKLPLPKTDFVSKHIMNLPLYSDMPRKHIIQVCSVIKKSFKKRK